MADPNIIVGVPVYPESGIRAPGTGEDLDQVTLGRLAQDLADAAEYAKQTAESAGDSVKATLFAAKAAATSNVASLTGSVTLDGVLCSGGDRVFLFQQTTQSQNGPWIVGTPWTRPTDFNTNSKVVSGQLISVTSGATYAGQIFQLVSSGPFTLGTTALVWSQVGGGGGSSAGTIQPVDLVLTSNDTLSGLAARDGVTPTAGMRVLATGQSTASQNGVYVAASGAWTRAADCDADGDLVIGQTIYAKSGTLGAKTRWQLTAGTTIAGSKTYERVINALAIQDSRGLAPTPRDLARVLGIDVDDDSVNGRTVLDAGHITPKNYGASPYWVGNVTTHTCTAGSGTVALGGIAKFRTGNWILLHQAGVAHGLATPAAPTVVVQGATGTRTLSFKVVALTSQWGYTAASTATTISNAPSSYSDTNYVEVFCGDVPGAHKYLIYCQLDGAGAYYLVGAVIAHPQYNENGQIYPLTYKVSFAGCLTSKTPTAGLPATAPAAAVPNAWRTKIISGGGTTALTVSPAPRSTVSVAAVAEVCNLIPLQDCIRHGGNLVIGGRIRVSSNAYTDGYPITGDLIVDRCVHLQGDNNAAGLSISRLVWKDGCTLAFHNTTGAEAWSPRRQTRVGDRVTCVTRTGNLRTYECTAVASTDGTWGVTGATEPVWDDSAPSVTQPTDGEITWRAWGFTGGLSSSAQQSTVQGLNLYWPEHVIPCGRFFIADDYRNSSRKRTLRTNTPNWQASTAYGAGVYRLPTIANANGKIYLSSGGTSGASEPTWPKTVGATVVDGTITWTCVDQKFVQGAMVLIGTQMQLKSVAIDGGRGCGVVWDGCSIQTGGATNKSFSEDVIIDRTYGGHPFVSQGSDGSACLHVTPKIGVPADVSTGNVDHGSCAILDSSFYGNIYFGVLCDGGWRAQNDGFTQCIGALISCYFEGTAGADADWNSPSQIRGGLFAGGVRSGCTPLVSDFVNPADLTSPFDSWKTLYDYASGLSRYLNAGYEYTVTDPNLTSYAARTRGGTFKRFNSTPGYWEEGAVTELGNTPTAQQYLFDYRVLTPQFPRGLLVGDRLGKISVVSAIPTSGVFLPGDKLLWYTEGSAAGPPRKEIIARRRGQLGGVARANSTTYAKGTILTQGGKTFVVVVGGTTASSAPASYGAATFGTYIDDDGSCRLQCWNTTTNSPLLQAVPLVGERVADTDIDNTFGISSGTHILLPDPAADRTKRILRTAAMAGDEMLFVCLAATSHSITVVDDTSSATLFVVPAASAFTSYTIRMNDAGAWERIR